MNENRLLEEVFARTENHIAPFGADVAHQFKERPVVVNVPEQVREEDQERRGTAEPYPFVQEETAVLGEEQADHNSEAEDRDGVFLLETETRDCAKPEPEARLAAFHGENREVRATHPQVWFKAVCGEQAAVGKILRRDQNGDGTQQESKAAPAEFAGDEGRLNDQQRRGQRRDESNGAEGIAEQRAGDVRNEWN